MSEYKLNKSMIIHALKLSSSISQAAIILGVGRATLWRALRRLELDPKAYLETSETPVLTIAKIAVNRVGKAHNHSSTASEYSGIHLGDYSRNRR